MPVVARLMHLTAPTLPSHRPLDFPPSLEHYFGLYYRHYSHKNCVFVRSEKKLIFEARLYFRSRFNPTNLAFRKEQRQINLKANKSTRYKYQTVLKILPHVLYVALASKKLTKFHQKTS